MEHLSEVVQALCDASDDTIRRFLGGIERSKLRLATERLQCAESSADTRHPRIPTAAQSTPETNKLAERLIARTQELEQFFTRSVEVAVGEPPWLEEDYRIVDIRLAPGGKQRGSLRADFRRALGERSLASDFDAHDPTRLEEILQSKTFILTRGRRSANSYSSFLRQGNFPEDTQRVAREAISVGLKYLAVERSEPTLGLGISALLAFAHEPLKTIELGTLLDTIRSSEFAHLRALALRIPEWTSQAQNLYATQSQLHSVERSLKRRCATTDKDSRLGPPQSSIDVLAAVATGSLNSVAAPMPALDICTADSSCQVQQLSAPGLLNNNGPPRQSSGTLSLEPGCSAYDDSASSAFHQDTIATQQPVNREPRSKAQLQAAGGRAPPSLRSEASHQQNSAAAGDITAGAAEPGNFTSFGNLMSLDNYLIAQPADFTSFGDAHALLGVRPGDFTFFGQSFGDESTVLRV